MDIAYRFKCKRIDMLNPPDRKKVTKRFGTYKIDGEMSGYDIIRTIMDIDMPASVVEEMLSLYRLCPDKMVKEFTVARERICTADYCEFCLRFVLEAKYQKYTQTKPFKRFIKAVKL